MHVQQRPEDQLPHLAASCQEAVLGMQHLPPVLHCQPSSECAEKNGAARLKCAVPSTLPSTWPSPTPQGDQGMHRT